MQVRIVSEYHDNKEAKIVADVLEADNRTAPNDLFVKSYSDENKVFSEIKASKIETLIATADDLLCSQRLAEDVLGET